MKTLGTIIKILTALATVAGAVYLIATYGDKIVAWAKEMLAKFPCDCSLKATAEISAEETVSEEEAPAEEPVEEVVEEATAAEEAPAEEIPAVEVEEDAPVADESDFEG